MDITIGYAPKATISNKTDLIPVTYDNLDVLVEYQNTNKRTNVKCDKNKHYVIFPHVGKREEATQSNVCFIDIDTTHEVGFVLHHSEELFHLCSNILFIKASHRDKLHIVCTMGNGTMYAGDDYRREVAIYTVYIIRAINFLYKKHKGKDATLNYIELGAVDNHNTKMTQPLYVSHKPIIFNRYHDPIDIDTQMKSSDIDTLLSYAIKHKIYEPTNHNKTYTNPQFEHRDVQAYLPECATKIKIDKHLKIQKPDGTYESGTNVRYKVMSELIKMFGYDGAVKFCHKYFINAEEVIRSCSRKDGYGANFFHIREWILDLAQQNREKHVKTVENIENITEEELNRDYVYKQIPQDKYVSDVKDDIIKYYKKHKRIQLIAPTGSGKTTLITKHLTNMKIDKPIVVLVPYISVVKKLYVELTVVLSDNGQRYDSEKRCVMVWDQALKYIEIFTNALIILDESHCCFLDGLYRDSAVQLMKMLKKHNTDVISISATPTGEVGELGFKVLEYHKEKINPPRMWVQYCDEDNEYFDSRIFDAIRKNIDKYDHIVVFNDEYNKWLYGHCYINGYDVRCIRANTMKENADFLDMEMVTNKVTLITRVGFNGLNFNNTDTILIIMIYKNGLNITADVDQCVGRFRKAKDCDCIVFLQTAYSEMPDITDDVAVTKHFINQGFNPVELNLNHKLTDDDYVEQYNSIRKYTSVNAHWGKTASELIRKGYVIKENYPKKVDLQSNRNPLKVEASNAWKEFKVNGTPLPDKEELIPFLNELENANLNLKITYGECYDESVMLVDYIKYKAKETLAGTIIENIRKILMVTTKTDEEYDVFISKLQKIYNELFPVEKDLPLQRLKEMAVVKGTLREYQKIRSKYGHKLSSAEIHNATVDEYMKELFDYTEKKRKASLAGVEKRKIVGYSTKKIYCWFKKKLYIFNTVKEYFEVGHSLGYTTKELKQKQCNKNEYKEFNKLKV